MHLPFLAKVVQTGASDWLCIPEVNFRPRNSSTAMLGNHPFRYTGPLNTSLGTHPWTEVSIYVPEVILYEQLRTLASLHSLLGFPE